MSFCQILMSHIIIAKRIKNKNTGSKNDPNAMREHDSPVSSFTSVELLNLRTAFHQQLSFLLILDRHPCRGLDRHQA